MPDQNQKLVTRNLSPTMDDFLGSTNPEEQRQNILAMSALATAAASASFIDNGGTWAEWYNVQSKACELNRQTTEVFSRAVNGDTDAIAQIAKDLDLPQDVVASHLKTASDVNQGQAAYAGTLTSKEVIGAIGSGLGLYNDSL